MCTPTLAKHNCTPSRREFEYLLLFCFQFRVCLCMSVRIDHTFRPRNLILVEGSLGHEKHNTFWADPDRLDLWKGTGDYRYNHGMLYINLVCFSPDKTRSNNNPFWELCRKIRPMVLNNYPLSARCSTVLSLFFVFFFEILVFTHFMGMRIIIIHVVHYVRKYFPSGT